MEVAICQSVHVDVEENALRQLIQDLKLSKDVSLRNKGKAIDLAFESQKYAMVGEYKALTERGKLSRDVLVSVLYERADTLITAEKDRTDVEEGNEGMEDTHLLTGS